MSCVVRRIAARGSRRIRAVPYDAADLRDAARHELPGGVYAAFGTWHDHSVIRLTDHFDRFEDSARRVGFELSLDRPLVCTELCEMIREAGFSGARFRVSAHPADFAAAEDGLLTVAMEPYAGPPPEIRVRGVSCRTAPHAARANPRAKQTSWLSARASLAAPDSTRHEPPYEFLLLDDAGRVLEGASSNFYAVLPPGELHTAGTGVLFGIARSIVLEIAPEVVPVRLDAPAASEIPAMQEAFVTSASRGVVPVVRIDETQLGDGTPGPVTLELCRRYDERAAALEEPLCADS